MNKQNETNRPTDIENKLMVTEGEGGRGGVEEEKNLHYNGVLLGFSEYHCAGCWNYK